jgi:hypothetical protein
MTPGLLYEAAGEGIGARIPAGLDLMAWHRPVARGSAIFREPPGFEEPGGVVKDKRRVQFQLRDLAGRRLVAIGVDFPRAGNGAIVREALEEERCLATHGEWAFE